MKKMKRIKALPLIIAAVVLLSLVCILPSMLMAESERIVVDLSKAELDSEMLYFFYDDNNKGPFGSGYNGDFVGVYAYDENEEAFAFSYASGANGDAGGRYKFALRFNEGYFTDEYKYMTICYKTNITKDADLLFYHPSGGATQILVDDLSAYSGEWTYSTPVELGDNMVSRLSQPSHLLLAATIEDTTGVEFYIKEIVFFKTLDDAEDYVAEAPAIPEPEGSDAISFITADEYGILADGTKIAVIKADENTKNYKYAGTQFYYAENFGGYAAIVDDYVTADAILSDADVTNTPTNFVINTNGDVNCDDSITAADAAYINRMLADPNGSYRDKSRLAAEVMASSGTITVDRADVYFVLRAAIGLSTTESDIPTDSVEVNGVIVPMTSLDAALEKLVVYNNDDVTGGTNVSYGDNTGSYEFHEQQEALLIKKSPSNYLNGYYRYHIRPINNQLLTNESWMVVMYRTNAKTSAEMKLVNNSAVGTDVAVLAEDITVSDDAWVFSKPVNIDTDLAEVDLFDRFTTTLNHCGLVVTLPEDTANDVYFFVKEIAFFASEREAKAYIANTTLPTATSVVLDLGLPEDEWVEPAVISFKSEGATKVNASVTDGAVEYTNDYALLADSVAAQFNSPAYVMDEHGYVTVYYKTTAGGTIKFNDTVIAADTSVSAGEWVNTKPIKLTADTKAALSEGDANVISYTGDGELTLGEMVLLSAPDQAATYAIGQSEPVATVEPITWVFASADGEEQKYEGSTWMGSKTMYDSGVKFVNDTDATRGYFEFDTIGGINALRIDRCDDSSIGYGGNHAFLRISKTQDYMPLKYMRIKYYVTGLDEDADQYIRFASGAGGVYAQTTENLVAKQDRWVYSQVLDLTELTSGDDVTAHNYSVLNRVHQSKIVYVGLFNAPADAKLYVSEITFYETKAQAYEDETMDAYETRYFDAKLGKFTVASVFDGDDEGMGKWTYAKKSGFTLTDAGDSNNGGNYRMAFRFVLHSMIKNNKYMRVVYKANNGSATEPVSLVTYSPKTGDTAIIQKNVQNTDEWVLSDTVLLTQDLFDRLGGTGIYKQNETYELIMQEHNFVAFQNTESDAEYAIRDIYFFSSLDDALNFQMPETPADPASEITVGNTTYESTEAISTVDAALGNAYKIYASGDKLYAAGGTDAAAAFAKKVADGRVLGGDTYEDIVEISVAGDFVLNGTCPTADPVGTVELKYDDRYTFDKAVAYVESTSITSTSVITGEADASVLKRTDGETFAASGIGTATVYFVDGTSTTVNVVPAKLSLVMIVGQSNGEGHSGDPYKSIRNVPGQVYSTYACAGYRYIVPVFNGTFTKGLDALSIYNSDVYIPKALTSTESRMGSELTYLPTDLTEGGFGKGGTDSAIAYEWNKTTGEKIWIVNAAHSGTSIDTWQPGSGKTNNNFWQAVGVFKSAQETVKAEIAAGHYELSKMGYFWLQGCNDAGKDSLWYTTRYKNMHEGFKKELAFDHDSDPSTDDRTMEFGAIMLVRYGLGENELEDFKINGVRMSQYFMGNEKTESWMDDIYLATDITNIFKTDADVAAYFTEKYGTEANFQAQNSVTYPMPLTVNDVHPSIHYCQAGYNEVGRDAAYNLIRQIGMVEAEAAEITIELLGADGYVFDHTAGLTLGANKSAIIVPDVAPRYLATDITVEHSSNIKRDTNSQYTFICTDGNAGYVTFRCGDASVTVNINN